AGPHVVTGLGRDDQLVAKWAEIGAHPAPEILLRGAVRRPVIIREVEMRDAEIECAAEDCPAGLEYVGTAEILPQAERDQREVQPAPAAAAIGHAAVVAGRFRTILLGNHGRSPSLSR